MLKLKDVELFKKKESKKEEPISSSVNPTVTDDGSRVDNKQSADKKETKTFP